LEKSLVGVNRSVVSFGIGAEKEGLVGVDAGRDAMGRFDVHFDELWTLSYRVAFKILGDREEASDVAQDAVFKTAQKWGRVEGFASAFAARVASQRAIDVIRRRRPLNASSRTGTPGFPVEERDELVDVLRGLPGRQRDTVVLRYLADLSERETADVLGCSPGAVKQHAARGLAALKAALIDLQTGA
jgi:DNA-directed RNA polymerase specialized sigma24 family protein